MSERTNLLWLGELLSQLGILLLSSLNAVVILRYFFAHVEDVPRIDNFFYWAVGIVILINVGAASWQWYQQQHKVDELAAKPDQWLVRWRYDQWSWQDYAVAERSHALWTTVKKWLLPILLFGILGIYLIAINLLLVGLSAWLLPYFRVLNTAPEAIITDSAVVIGGAAYFWKNGNAELRGIQFVAGEPNRLELKLRLRKGRNRSNSTVHVPIPKGQEAEAQQLVERLKGAVVTSRWWL